MAHSRHWRLIVNGTPLGRGEADAAALVFHVFRAQQQATFLPGLRKLGLDGLPLALARALAASGRLPNLERLLAHNATTIEAELPELSPVNWTSFLTAAGPGRHGIFGFVGIDPATYTLGPIDA